MYTMSKSKGSMSLAGAGNSGIYMSSPTTGEKIKLQEVIIPSDAIWASVYKSVYNSRSRELMTPATVMGILQSIRDAGRNMIPVIAVKDGEGKFEILSGMKRSYAVSISPGSSLVVHFAEEISEEDKKLVAKTADLHEKPSFLDTALSIKQYKDQVGDSFTLRGAAEIFGVGKSSVSDLIKFAELPNKLFKMFPGAGYITWRFLKTIADSNKTDEEIVGSLSLLEPIDSNIDKILSDNADELLKQECKAMEIKIIDALFAKKQRVSKSFSKESPFHESKLIPGVVSKIEPKGAVSLKISKQILDSDVGKQLLQLLSKV